MTRDELLKLAERHGFPRIPLRPGEHVAAGREAWKAFAANAYADDCRRVERELAKLPRDIAG